MSVSAWTSMSAVWAFALSAVAVFPRLTLAQHSINMVAAAPAPAGVSAASNKKIKMVTETLKDILQSVANEEKQETDLYRDYSNWCISEQTDISMDLRESKTELANAKVLSEEQVSSIDSLKVFISKTEKDIENTKDAIAQAAAIRNGENEEFTEEMQTNTQSLRQIDLAIKHVGTVQKQGGFLQGGVVEKLQINQPGESSYVFGVMRGLRDKLSKTRQMIEHTEKEKVKMHQSFMQTKGELLKALSDKKAEKKISLTETQAKESGVKQKIGKLTEQVAKLVDSGAKTKSSCETAHHEWKLRQADRTKEKAALNEAIRFLTESSLEQLSLVQHSAEEPNDDSVVFAPSLLQEIAASKITETAFYKAADAALMGEDDEVEGHMQKDTFNGVKTVVKKLIGTHQDTQKEEDSKRMYCQTEIALLSDEKATTTDDLAAIKADIDKKATEMEMLADEVKRLYAEIDQARKSLEAAGKVRKEEAVFFAAGSKDRALAIKVLKQAIGVLQNFYDEKKGKLLQVHAGEPPPKKWAAISPRKTASAFGAVSMVQDIADDIAKEQVDAETQEMEAAETFAQLQKDSRQSTDDRHQDITDRVTAKAKLGVQINTLKETSEEKANDLESINKQLSALHDSCDELLEFYERRKKARAFEVSQLRDVMDVLSGSSIAARTGFTQDSEAADNLEDGNVLDEASARE